MQRVVHISITNPSEESTLEYFRGHAIMEDLGHGDDKETGHRDPALVEAGNETQFGDGLLEVK